VARDAALRVINGDTDDDETGDEADDAGDEANTGDDEGEDGDAANGEDDATADTPEPVAAAATPTPRRRPTVAAVARRQAATGRRPTAATADPGAATHGRGRTEVRLAVGAATGRTGQATTADLFAAAADMAHRMGARDGQRTVGEAVIEYPEDRRFTDSPVVNAERIAALQAAAAGPDPTALAAAGGFGCAPAQPIYDVPVWGTDVRPFRDAMVDMQAPRGRVTAVEPMTVADLAGSAVIYTAAMDEAVDPDDPATWKPCVEVDCDTEDAELHAATSCITLGVFETRAHPEKVPAIERLATVVHARVAEQKLRDLFRAHPRVFAQTVGAQVSALPDLMFAVDVALATVGSAHRLGDQAWRLVLPDWTDRLVSIDRSRQLPATGDEMRYARQQFVADLQSRGVNVTFSPDLQVLAAPTADGALPSFPATVRWLLYPEGSLFFLNGGELRVDAYRDDELVRTNRYRQFMETFEGLLFRGVLGIDGTSTLCASGARIGAIDFACDPQSGAQGGEAA
jgi:hypothetical protein